MKLLTKKYNYYSINRIDSDNGRLYVTPDGEKVPSVTTILSKTASSEKTEMIDNWRKRVGHVNAKYITSEAAGRGTRMHKYLEEFIINGFIKEPGSNPFSKQSHKMAYIVIDKGLTQFSSIYGSEIGLFYPKLYAGTSDGIGMMCNNECILDYKQTNKPKKEEYIDDYYLQLVAYALAHNKVYNSNIKSGIILMCSAEYQYQEFKLSESNFSKWENKWWDRVEAYYR